MIVRSLVTRRHWAREVGTALLWPISFLQSKHKGRGLAPLSMQRLILGVSVWLVCTTPLASWTWPAVGALALVNFALIIETLFMNVPVREGLQALTALFGAAVAKRTRTVSIEETAEAPSPSPAEDGALG